MADDLSAAPSMGASEPAPAPAQADTTSAPASEAPKSADKPLSGREAASRALSEVMARAPGETDRAAAVLKEGAGADQKLDATHKDAVTKATDAEKAVNEAAERAKKGWETRRANAEQAKAEERTAGQVAEAVKAALPEQQPAPAPEAKPATVETKHPDAPIAAQDVVITVPASFDPAARELTAEAARAAGNSHAAAEMSELLMSLGGSVQGDDVFDV